MYLDAELEVPMNAMAAVANELGTVGGAAECEGTQPRPTRALQTIPIRCEADDPRFDRDLVPVIAVGQYDRAVAVTVFKHAQPLRAP
jgi:hypothetical protein